ncbi:hypothetical protein VP01_2360g4 [Puccinia sorghi]|uniref:Uncharacterized protein n=1 Tax=Puccinia sorghi TaxID=27349 RepID=A0A0L6V7W7_9BASI|nr:hypothetical protein VP01_2360g4 [Puccinia sorghi]
MNNSMVSDLQAALSQRDEVIAQLMARVEAVSQKTLKKSSTQKVSASKKYASKAPATLPQVTVTPPARKKSIPNSSSKNTPVRQCAPSATPVSAKKSPLQMTKKDHPEGHFSLILEFLLQNALYVHIKVLWGLIAQGFIPVPPSEEQLRSFYQRFQSTEEIQSTINRCPLLLAIYAIQTLKKACESCMKVRKHMIHLSDFNICYVQSSLSKQGLAVWVPNLDEQANSLYNVAHNMATLKTFCECVAGGHECQQIVCGQLGSLDASIQALHLG